MPNVLPDGTAVQFIDGATAAQFPPQGGAVVGEDGSQWSAYNLPPEALEAMGLDSGDYVMYAIVEEHYIAPDAIEVWTAPHSQNK